jgi:hypothetical protein
VHCGVAALGILRNGQIVDVAAGVLSRSWESVHFYRIPGGPWTLHSHGRAYPRVESSA